MPRSRNTKRDKAIMKLLEQGEAIDKVAAIFDISQSRVSQIKGAFVKKMKKEEVHDDPERLEEELPTSFSRIEIGRR